MLARLHSVHNDRENGNEDLIVIADNFRYCIVQFHRLFESFLKLSVDAVAIPVFLLQRVTHAIFLLVTIEGAISSIVDEKQQVVHVEELKTQLYLDGVVSLLRQITTQRPTRSVMGFAGLLTVLQNWMRQQSIGICSSPPPMSSRSQGDASETYAHGANVEGTSGASGSSNGPGYHGFDPSIMRSDVTSALRMVLGEDDIAMEYLGGFLELAEKSIQGDAGGA